MKVILHKKFDKDLFIDYISKGDEKRRDLYEKELDEVVNESFDYIEPVGYFYKHELNNEKVLSCLVTLGEKADNKINSYFELNEYLKGYYLNSLCDWILYSATDELYNIIKDNYKDFSISKRYNLETEEELVYQGRILSIINEYYNSNVKITSNYMLTPLKSVVYYYKIGEINRFGVDHSCDNCNHTKCDNRKVNLTLFGRENRTIKCEKNSNLLSVLQMNGININADCGGNKSCGKCKVKMISDEKNTIPITKTEQNMLSILELENNIRLACCQKVDRDVGLEIITGNNTKLEVNEDIEANQVNNIKYCDISQSIDKNIIAIDMGTTTIEISLLSSETNEIIDTHKYQNPQKIFGSDVMSRITYSLSDNTNMLTKIIRESVDIKILELLNSNNVNPKSITTIIVSANTTMNYFLLDKNIRDLSKSPYNVDKVNIAILDYEEIFSTSLFNAKVMIIPWNSAFIGGDIISGLYFSNFNNLEGSNIFIDIGTNGEIVLKSNNKLFATSTSAGPAFEGSNIKCGMMAIDGAIYKVEKIDNMYSYSTIGEKLPVGISGTGLIDLIGNLLIDNKIDANGKLIDVNKHFIYKSKDVEIMLYQDDIRQVQLAKAAIYTGIELLCRVANILYDDIKHVYIAGGFGSYLNIANAIRIGLLPKEFENKIKIIGNSSLNGAIKFAKDINGKEKINKIQKSIEAIDLNSIPDFQKVYLKNIDF